VRSSGVARPVALKSGVVPRSLILLSIVVFTACNRLPESYPPPPQRAPLTSTISELSYFVSLSDSNADTYLVRDFAPAAGAGPTRWAFDHPEEMRAMRVNARREYQEKYTAERNYKLLMTIYEMAIENSRRRRREAS